MRSFFGPLHLLFLAESSAHHFVHRRLHKPRRNRLAVVVPLAVIRDQVPVVRDIPTLSRCGSRKNYIPSLADLIDSSRCSEEGCLWNPSALSVWTIEEWWLL